MGPNARRRVGPQPPRPGWQESAACQTREIELFFGPEGETRFDRRRRENRAVAVCASCPVLARCRRHALLMPEQYGVWGGLTPGQRNAARRARRAAVPDRVA
jgi:WhiB family transcriptional regulator, redox-sensing transcriptional regulator